VLLLVIVIEQAITITKRAGSWVEQEVKKVFTACKHFSKRRMLRQLEIKMWFLAVLSGIEQFNSSRPVGLKRLFWHQTKCSHDPF